MFRYLHDVRLWDQFDSNSLEVFIQLYKLLLLHWLCWIMVILPVQIYNSDLSVSLSLISSFLFNFFYPSLFTSTSWSRKSKNTKQEQGSKKIEVNDLLLSFLVRFKNLFWYARLKSTHNQIMERHPFFHIILTETKSNINKVNKKKWTENKIEYNIKQYYSSQSIDFIYTVSEKRATKWEANDRMKLMRNV